MGENQIILEGMMPTLRKKNKMVMKIDGKQLLLVQNGDMIYACNNRCPHEGYPLAEGTVSEGCILTCNWHNWKFDLARGDTLVGGDKLRLYPVEVKGDDILIDMSDLPKDQLIAQALNNLEESFRLHEYDRMAREIARLQKAGGDALDALRHAIWKTYDKMEFGATHAFAGAADWLQLREQFGTNDVMRLIPIVEAVGHFSWDTQREANYPFTNEVKDYDSDALVLAIEQENEDEAVALMRGGLRDGLHYSDFEEALSTAALAHYAGFGHSLIYVYKAGQLIAALGNEVAEPVLLALVRSLIFASREDLIPEFKAYAPALDKWDGRGQAPVSPDDFIGLSIREALNKCLSASSDITGLYTAMLGANARNMLKFDLAVQARTDNQVQHNVGWLDFTHGLTFSNAVRNQCSKFPHLWAKGLLQMACFSGRNMPYIDAKLDVRQWQVKDSEMFLKENLVGLFDHGNPEFIVSCHLVKLLSAAAEEVAHNPNHIATTDMLAAVNRFLNEPLKRKHAKRVAQQSLDFVARED